jgi:iron complex transport system ATP-binding protein
MELLRSAAHQGSAVLAVLHDLSLAARFADHVLLMQGGRIVTQGEVKDALTEERIASVFGISAQMTDVDGTRIPIARRPL